MLHSDPTLQLIIDVLRIIELAKSLGLGNFLGNLT
jgi:hypothetical protein